MWPITDLRTLNSYGYALILIYFYTEAELGNSVEKQKKIHVALNADPL